MAKKIKSQVAKNVNFALVAYQEPKSFQETIGFKPTIDVDVVYQEPKPIVEMISFNPTPIVSETSTKKSILAQAIFDECYKMVPVPQRKDIINRLTLEAKLTKAGAATYLQNMKKKAGYVQAKA